MAQLNWSKVFTGALFTVFGRPPKKASTTKRPLTLRIEEVPIDKSREDFEHDLKSIVKRDPDLKDDSIVLVQYFLVRRDQRMACATATLLTSIPVNEVIRKLRQAGSSLPYRFDAKFYGITPLYEGHEGADVDVIAVPSLGSHAIGSWKSPSSNDLWLRDYLPDDLPNIRVLLYGYDTSLLDNESKDSIEDLGSRFLESIKAFRADTTNHRPIIFIGHSLGGLLIKEALVRARKKSDDPQNLALCKACYGLLLFGVPNLGLRNEQLNSIVQGRPNQVLIRDLVVDDDSEPSPFLKRISDQFSECCKGQYRVISFFERKRSSTVQIRPDGTLAKIGPKTFMVTQKSATSTGLTAVADENNISLNMDHSGLVKYESRTQEEYNIVKEKLKVLVAGAKHEVGRRFAENSLRPEQERLWSNLNQPPYKSLRNSSKLAKPERGTLEWLVQPEIVDHKPESRSESPSQRSLTMKDFTSWRDSNNSESLLVTAPPGRGKSVLSNFVLGHLESRVPHEPSTATKIIYYFCNIRNDEASHNANSILRALIVQLCEHQQRLFRILPPEYETNSHRFFSASFHTLWHTFEMMLRDGAYARVECVIDGLDVYQEGMDEFISQFTNTFSRRTETGSPVLKLLCTSRPEKDILDLWEPSMHRVLRCNPHDLDIFIDSRVGSLGKSFTDDMKQMVKNQLRMQAEGTFLWLEVVIRRITSIDVPTPRKIKETINASPQDLDDLYRLLVLRLVQKDIVNARFLAWVVYARRPLDLKELEDAMAINPKETYTNYEQCLKDRPRLVSEEVHKDFGTLLDIAEGKVYLIHQSVKDYFERRDPLQAYTEVTPRLVLAHVSMAYLSLEDFGRPRQNISMLQREFPLISYAASYWYSHIETTADIDCSLPLQHFLKEIMPPNNSKAQIWMRAHSNRHGPPYPSRISNIAIKFDIGWLAELLLNGTVCSVKDDFEEDCLSSAAHHKGAVLQVLLKHERGMKLAVTDEAVLCIAKYHHHCMMALLLDQRGADVVITEEVVKAAAGNEGSGMEVMTLLLDRRGADVVITEEVVKAAAGNGGSGMEVVTLLLDRRGADVVITEEVVKAAAGNGGSGKEVMTLLLDRRGADVAITEEVVKAAAGNGGSGKEVMTLLLDRRGADVAITEEVVKAAAGNGGGGKEVMTLLLDRRGADVAITEEVMKAAAGNEGSGKKVMTLLLDRRGADVAITEEVVKAAAGNGGGGKKVMTLLLDRRGADVAITEEVVKAAAGNGGSGKEVITLLLDRRGADVAITEEVVKAAAGNEGSGKEVITLLLDRREKDVQITEEVVKTAAKNYRSGKEVINLFESRPEVKTTEEAAASTSTPLTRNGRSDRTGSSIFASEQHEITEATSFSNYRVLLEGQDHQNSHDSKPSVKQHEDGDDVSSMMSADTIEMTPEKDSEIILNFADALYDRIRDIELFFNGSDTFFNMLLETKIKKFSKSVKKDNPRGTIELKPKRKVVKAIYRLRLHISTRLEKRIGKNIGTQDDLKSHGSGPAEFSERPLPGVDIPQETLDQKFQRLHPDYNENTPETLYQGSSDRDQGSESSESHSSLLDMRPDFWILHEYFREHPAFDDLVLDTRRLIKHFRVNTLEHIRHSLYQVEDVALNSANNLHRKVEACIHADWDLLRFLKERQSHGLRDELGSVLTITGNSQEAQLNTVAQFIRQTWKTQSDALLPALQKKVSGQSGKISVPTSSRPPIYF
ncbi:hypothetical protein K469DRAFT_812982 [Zopfia rhizophila CBS 207.26]|uniref:Uncharacterized protein n=1 Tax=Zopfia rhizophila CBS 207.26 TaxID=1314779 RepID=A0A6A6DDS3_9PEZI|nr:hypothetical protein K469DRAFT_812982 [Zopfia rhizophila CBS 207.26]